MTGPADKAVLDGVQCAWTVGGAGCLRMDSD